MAITSTDGTQFIRPRRVQIKWGQVQLFSRVWVGLSLVGCMLFVIWIAVFYSFSQSLRLDESQSLWQASHSPTQILHIISKDVHVPLYHLILHYWLLFFGNSVAAGRGLSLIWGVLSVPAMYLLAWQAFRSKTVALFSAFLFSISPFMNWYASEIRMYSMLAFLTTIHQYFFLRIYRQSSDWAWWGLLVTAILGIYTHYFFGLILFTNALFIVLNREVFGVRAIWRLVVVACILGASFAPWIALVISAGSASNT